MSDTESKIHTRKKIDKLDPIKIENIYALKNTTKKIR